MDTTTIEEQILFVEEHFPALTPEWMVEVVHERLKYQCNDERSFEEIEEVLERMMR